MSTDWIERLRELAAAHPHADIEYLGSPEMIAAVTSGRVSVHDALQAWQAGLIDDARAMELSGCESVAELYQAAYSSDVEILFARPVVVCIPGVMSGDPVIAGTRVLAEQVLIEHATGSDEAQIREDYPTLPEGVLQAVLEWSRSDAGRQYLATRQPF